MERVSAEPYPKVSIVITAYNAQRFILASVSAALKQDYPNYEVIVLDDGSSDATEAICRAVGDQRFRYVRRERLGRQKALNAAISMADGEYIAINDADDLSFPRRLTDSVRSFREHKDLVLMGTAYEFTPAFHDTIPGHFVSNIADVQHPLQSVGSLRLYRSNPFVHSTVMFPKALWASLGGYDASLGNLGVEDYDFYLRAIRYGRIGWLPRVTVLWYTNPCGFFKTRATLGEYVKVLWLIKQRARPSLSLPFWARLYDVLPLVYYGMERLRRRREQAVT